MSTRKDLVGDRPQREKVKEKVCLINIEVREMQILFSCIIS